MRQHLFKAQENDLSIFKNVESSQGRAPDRQECRPEALRLRSAVREHDRIHVRERVAVRELDHVQERDAVCELYRVVETVTGGFTTGEFITRALITGGLTTWRIHHPVDSPPGGSTTGGP